MNSSIPRLEIDGAKLSEQLEGIGSTYTDFGAAVAGLSVAMEDTTVRLASRARRQDLGAFFYSVDVLADDGSLLDLSAMKDLDSHQHRIAAAFEEVGAFKSDAPKEVKPVGKVKLESPKSYAKFTEFLDREVSESFRLSGEPMEKLRDLWENRSVMMGRLVSHVKTEFHNTLAAVRKLAQKAPGNLGGGFLSALLGAAVLGYTEKDRKRQGFGQMANVFESGVDSMFSKEAQRASSWFGKWAEKAQWYWGVGLEETRGTIKTYVDMGMSATELRKERFPSLGDVGKNIVTLSIGLEKHLNMASGTASKDIVKLISEYGVETGKAAQMYTRILGAGQRSGRGALRFARFVLDGGSALANYGVSAASVANLLETVAGYYDDFGLDKRYSGEYAGNVVTNLLSAFKNIDFSLRVALARKMFKDSGEEDPYVLARMFGDGLSRVGTPEQDAFLEDLLKAYLELSKERGFNDRYGMIRSHKALLKVDDATAALLEDIRPTLEMGGGLKDLATEQQSGLKESFQTESKRVSSLFKTRRRMITGIAMIGDSVLAMLVKLLAMTVLGARGLIAFGSAWSKDRGTSGIVHQTFKAMGSIYDTMGADLEKAKKGGGKALKALYTEFATTVKPTVDIWNSYEVPDAGRDPVPLPSAIGGSTVGAQSKPWGESPVEGAQKAGDEWVGPEGNLFSKGGERTGGRVPGTEEFDFQAGRDALPHAAHTLSFGLAGFDGEERRKKRAFIIGEYIKRKNKIKPRPAVSADWTQDSKSAIRMGVEVLGRVAESVQIQQTRNGAQ